MTILPPLCRRTGIRLTVLILMTACGGDSGGDSGQAGPLPDFADTTVSGKVGGKDFVVSGARAAIDDEEDGTQSLRLDLLSGEVEHACFWSSIQYEEYSYITHTAKNQTGEYEFSPLDFNSDTEAVLLNFVHKQKDDTTPLNFLVGRGKIAIDEITETQVTGRLFAQEDDGGEDYLVNGTFTAVLCQQIQVGTSGIPSEHLGGVYGAFTGADGKSYVSFPKSSFENQNLGVFGHEEEYKSAGTSFDYEASTGALKRNLAFADEVSIFHKADSCPTESPLKEACELAEKAASLAQTVHELGVVVDVNLITAPDVEQWGTLSELAQVLLDNPDDLKSYIEQNGVKEIDIGVQPPSNDAFLSGTDLSLHISEVGLTASDLRDEIKP